MTSVIELVPKCLLPNTDDFIFASRSKCMYVCMYGAIIHMLEYVFVFILSASFRLIWYL